jgi:RHS repeat-associated protein
MVNSADQASTPGAGPPAGIADSGKAAREALPLRAPAVALPKGGGAIRGIGERFSANTMTGTASLSVPVYSSPGRAGFGPTLTLTYDSGAGNGPYGLGWSLALPSITRKTDKGLPQYRDAENSDIYMLTGVDDLVPVLVNGAQGWLPQSIQRTLYGATYLVSTYRPRVEGLFSRIERWARVDDPTDVFWRSISKDNVTAWYGRTAESRVADPEDPTRIFSWLICESYDDKGNLIEYGFKPEDSAGVDHSQIHERNRSDAGRSAGRYPRFVRYGYRTAYYPQLDAPQAVAPPTDYLFELVFDYGEYDPNVPLPGVEVQPWALRPDPFSTYRPCFELRTYRRCQRILMFHHFADEADVGMNCLVRATQLGYADASVDPSDPIYSLLASITQVGYRRQGAGYLSKAAPALAFGYSAPSIDDTVRDLDAQSLRNLPAGMDGNRYQWIDLDGEGASGILSEQDGAWYFKANLSPANIVSSTAGTTTLASFAPVERLATLPSPAALSSGRQQLVSLAANGLMDLVDFEGPSPGFSERNSDGTWSPWTNLDALPVLDWNNPQLRFIDLTGDGFADLLIAYDQAFCWHASLGKAGFANAQRVAQSLDEEQGPKLVFSDSTESIFLADMSGDGLSDLVRVRNGETCYWPNLGYARFGAKVSMDDAPWFDTPDLFSARRVRLADIDGSGTADLVYFSSRSTQLHFNLSGNGFAAPRVLSSAPTLDNVDSAQAIDLLGNGTSCLVWSSPLPMRATAPLCWVDLMSGNKPHLLTRIDNNLGSETLVSYAPSTRFYVADKLAGTPWLTRIPFPVQVVEQVELRDWIGRNRFVTRYAYHDGYFDGVEREFRGFGKVEQWDTGELATVSGSDAFPNPANEDSASFLPPVCTRTWFHTGAYIEEAGVSAQYATQYYQEPGLSDAQQQAMLLPDTVLPTAIRLGDGSSLPYAIAPDEAREAVRALRGSILRQEVYAEDGTLAAALPYSASERNYTIEMLQPLAGNPHAVFYAHPRETIDLHYERSLYTVGARTLADPRVSHTFTLDTDVYGNVLLSATVAYGRRHGDASLSAEDQALQAASLLAATRSDYTTTIDLPDARRTPLGAETHTYQLVRCTPQGNDPDITNLFGFDELAAQIAQAGDGAHDLPYEDVWAAGAVAAHPYQRLIGATRTLYLADDLSGALPLGQAGTLGLEFERYLQVLTPGLVSALYGAKLPGPQLTSVLLGDAQYRDLDADGNLWLPSGRGFYSPDPNAPDAAFAKANFFLTQSVRDPFGNLTLVSHDAYDLLVAGTQDALGNTISVQNDYRVLQPSILTDPNGNRQMASFDALGLVAGTAVMGKTTETLGDSLTGFVADLTPAQIGAYVDSDDPHTSAPALLANATTRIVYDLDRFSDSRTANPNDPTQWQPAFSSTISRETHVSDLTQGQTSLLLIAFSYGDGFGQEIQKKLQAEPAVSGGALRWIGSGWTIHDNKGQPVRQYEPFFSALPVRQHLFEYGTTVGVSAIAVRDPLGRTMATVRPNQSWEKLVLDPWRSQSWDANDTVAQADPRTDPDAGDWLARLPVATLLPTWYQQRIGGGLGAAAQAAAQKAAQHAATPSRASFDAAGRSFLDVADNGADGLYLTHSKLDVQGNVRAAVDELGRLAAAYDYDMLGTRIHQASMEAGERWTLNDVLGQALRAWDSRGHAFRSDYDALRRPLGKYVLGTDPVNSDPRTLAKEVQYGKWSYGETLAGAAALNLLTRVYQQFDPAGLLTHRGTDPSSGTDLAYDFKGNLRAQVRQLVSDYIALPDWSAAPALGESFLTLDAYDALNRLLQTTAPDGSRIAPAYNATGLLQRIDIRLQAAEVATAFVTDIGYNARAQRVSITHGNGTQTTYDYDPLTFRLIGLGTVRNGFGAGAGVVQQLSYTDDPVGNITHIQDDADIQNVIYFRNRRVAPSADYTFDPTYRLVQASGREQLGQPGGPGLVPGPASYNDQPRIGLPQPGDGNAVGTYVEAYTYDAAGNLLRIGHTGSDPANPGWSRVYAYAETSALDATQVSNRLSRTTLNPQGLGAQIEPYSHDLHGNMTGMPQLQVMQWDFRDRLCLTQRQAVNGDDADGILHQGERTYFMCDADGQRVRKVTQRANGTLMKERIYADGFEAYREYDGTGNTVTLERQTLNVMDGARRVALVETRTQGSDASPAQLIRYQYANHLGSACLELDATAQVISYEEYYPFGSTSYQAIDASIRTSAKRYRFSAIERDEETGLDCHLARYCAPWLGRWVSCDPAGLVDGPNLYRYARNAPTTLIDRRGTDPQAPEQPPPKPPDPPPDPTQAQQQNSGFSNGAAVQPEGVQTSEFTLQGFGGGGSPGTSGAGSFLYHYRNVTAPGREFGLQLGFGGAASSDSPSVGTGTIVGTLHLGQEPSDDLSATNQSLVGGYFGAGFLWGQNPTVTDTFPGDTREVGGANPTGFAQFAYSYLRSRVEGVTQPHLHQTLEFDADLALAAQRYGAINGVTTSALVQPSVVVNLALNDVPGRGWQTNFELGATANIGLGGVVPDPTGKTTVTGAGATGVPFSLTTTAGVGFTKTWGDYAISIEPYVQHEALPNVATTGDTGSFWNGAWVGGVKVGFTAINVPGMK